MQNKLVIDRSKWRFGGQDAAEDEDNSTMLLNDRGLMCCLGFESIRCGVSMEYILNIPSPQQLKPLEKKKIQHLLNFNTESEFNCTFNSTFTLKAIQINDSTEYTKIQREQKLIELFGEKNIELTFIGEYR